MAETCEEIVSALLEHLQDVAGAETIARGEHQAPDNLDALPAIILLEGEDVVTEATRRGNKRSWDLYLGLLVKGTDADSMLYELATFREAVRTQMQAFRRPMAQQWNGVIYETGRGIPADAEMGNFMVAQTLAYKAIYAEPPLS